MPHARCVAGTGEEKGCPDCSAKCCRDTLSQGLCALAWACELVPDAWGTWERLMVHIARLSPWRQAQERTVCWELCRPIKCKQFRASTWAHDDTAISQIRTSSPAEDILLSARAGQRDQSTAALCRACESAEDAADSQQHARASHRSNSTLGAWPWLQRGGLGHVAGYALIALTKKQAT